MIDDREESQTHDNSVQPAGGFFGQPRLQSLKAITTWGGVLATFSGIVLSVVTGGSLQAAGIASLGLLLTCGGHLINGALQKQQAKKNVDVTESLHREIQKREDHLREQLDWMVGHS